MDTMDGTTYFARAESCVFKMIMKLAIASLKM